MCTTTVYLGESRRVITMNRDESRTRAPEIEPQSILAEDGRTRILMPIDGTSGGTWLGVNSHGLAAFLMNVYESEPSQTEPFDYPRSRGEIVPRLLRGETAGEAEDIFGTDVDPSDYPPFLLGIVGSDEVTAWIWKGLAGLEREVSRGPWTFFTSSSVQPKEVARSRRESFERWLGFEGNEPEGVLGFHFHQDPLNPSGSPLMSREVSYTRSITQVTIDEMRCEISMRYWPGPFPNDATHAVSSMNTMRLEVDCNERQSKRR